MHAQKNMLIKCLRILHQPATYTHTSWRDMASGRPLLQVWVDAQLRRTSNLHPGNAPQILDDDIGTLLVRHWKALPTFATMLNTWLLGAEIVSKNLLHTLEPTHRALLHLPISPPAAPASRTHGTVAYIDARAGMQALIHCAHSVSPALGQRVALVLPKQNSALCFTHQDTMKIRSALKFSACYVAQT